jgi:hypothetical protein
MICGDPLLNKSPLLPISLVFLGHQALA